MKITISLDDDLVRKAREIAASKNTTLEALIQVQLEQLADLETSNSGADLHALELSFERYRFRLGNRSWARTDLYERT